SKPSIPGSPMSSTTSRTGCRRSSPTASSPLRTQTTIQPSCCSRYALTRRPIASSSSTRRRTPPVAARAMSPMYLPAEAFYLHERRRRVCLPVDDDAQAAAQLGDAAEAGGALDAGARIELNRDGGAVPLAERDVRPGDGGDHAAVDPPVLRGPGLVDDHLGANHARPEELIDDCLRKGEAALG